MPGPTLSSLACIVRLILLPAPPLAGAEERGSPSRAIGLALRALPDDDLEEIEEILGVRCGVEVEGVAPDSPAARAGLRAKDVLIALGGRPVDSPAAVDRVLAGKEGRVEFAGMRPTEDDFEPLMGAISIPAARHAPPAGKGDPAAEKGPAPGEGPAPAYRDPLGRFEMPQPDGWTAQAFPNGEGASLVRGGAAISAMLFPGSRSASELLESVLEETRKQWKDLREGDREARTIDGREARTIAISGASPKGGESRARIAALATKETGLVLVLTSPAAEFDAADAAWRKVVDGLRLTAEGALGKKGKTYRHAIGFSFRHPGEWTVEEKPDFLQLIPPDPGSSPEGPTEVYFILGESLAGEGIRAADDPRIAQYLDEQVRSVAPALRRVGGASAVPMAKGMGSVIAWEGTSSAGSAVRALAFVTILSDHGVALVALGLDDGIRKRDADLRQIFASFGFGESEKDPRLVGGWLYEENFWSGTYWSTTIRTLTLRPDGSFVWTGQFFAGMDHTDAGGDVTGRTSRASDRSGERGRWGASGGKLFLFFDDGSYAEYGYAVEDAGDERVMLLETSGGKKQLWTQKT